MAHRYLIALGGNVPHARHGRPEHVLRAALAALEDSGLRVERASRIVASAPLGPSLRRYANAAALVVADAEPAEVLVRLKAVERHFGRKRGGRRWGARVLDLDIVLWEGGAWCDGTLTVPHPAMRERAFVLGPAAQVAPSWRDPIGGLTIRQLKARLTRKGAVPR